MGVWARAYYRFSLFCAGALTVARAPAWRSARLSDSVNIVNTLFDQVLNGMLGSTGQIGYFWFEEQKWGFVIGLKYQVCAKIGFSMPGSSLNSCALRGNFTMAAGFSDTVGLEPRLPAAWPQCRTTALAVFSSPGPLTSVGAVIGYCYSPLLSGLRPAIPEIARP